MPGKLGKCPTCKKEVSTSAKSCPHCGEKDFVESGPEQVKIVDCLACGGKKTCVSDRYPKGGPCPYCGGKGKARMKGHFVDLRTGECDFRTYESLLDPSAENTSGCASIILLALTLASALLIAVLI